MDSVSIDHQRLIGFGLDTLSIDNEQLGTHSNAGIIFPAL